MQPWKWKRGIDFPMDAFDDIAARFEAGFYEQATSIEPENVEFLLSLGSVYSRLGLIEKSLEVDLKLVRMRPEDSMFHYNLACSYSLTGRVDQAFAALRNAIKLGYGNLEHITRDRDLDNLKSDRRYHDIIDQLELNYES